MTTDIQPGPGVVEAIEVQRSLSDDRIVAELRRLYKAHPFTKAIPFNIALPVAGIFADLWTPVSATFELGAILCRCNVAAIDLDICDSTIENVIYRVIPPDTSYRFDLIMPGVRSLNLQGKVGVSNPAGTPATIFKGVLYGWEVTREGNYR